MTREQRLEAALRELVKAHDAERDAAQRPMGGSARGWTRAETRRHDRALDAFYEAVESARQALALPADVESVAQERIALLQANYTVGLNAEGTARLDALTAELRELVPRVTPGDIAALAQMRRVLGVDASAEGPPPGDEAACRALATQQVLAEKSLWRRWQWCDDHAPPDAVAVDLPRAPLVRWLQTEASRGK